ncbi:MAG TPA: GrpB family protein [Armatimonadota bacterium]|nr:GrpB family protein [Armatimonadota bacterium]
MERQIFTVKITPSDPAAPIVFVEVAEFIRQVSPCDVHVEHVGSTSIPNVAGKGIIDCMVTGPHDRMDEIQRAISEAGMDHNSSSHPDPDRWYASGSFTQACGARMHVHIHITYPGSACEIDHLRFRDYLRANRREAVRYVRMKHEWRARVGDDRVVFTDAKTPYIQSVLAKAKAGIEGTEA